MPIPVAGSSSLLFTAADLGDWLHCTVSDTVALSVERVVWGWLKPVLGLTDRPNPVPDEVFAWAIELGAIAHENPSGLASRQLSEEWQRFSAERRREILDEAGSGGVNATGVPSPQGSFPAADCPPWPDRARPTGRGYWVNYQ